MKRNTALDFVAAINSRNVDTICNLMTDNHLFIDSQGNKLAGKDTMKHAWQGYFEMFPDYTIEIAETLENENIIVLLGYAEATYKNLKTEENSKHWKVPAAFRAVIAENKIKLWQVYADNSPAFNIINKHHD